MKISICSTCGLPFEHSIGRSQVQYGYVDKTGKYIKSDCQRERERQSKKGIDQSGKNRKPKPILSHESQKKKRVCLGHLHIEKDYEFMSTHPGNRICEKCRNSTPSIQTKKISGRFPEVF